MWSLRLEDKSSVSLTLCYNKLAKACQAKDNPYLLITDGLRWVYSQTALDEA